MVLSVEKKEWDDVMALWERSVRATHHFLDPADIPYYRDMLRDNYLQELRLFCIKEDGRMAGVAGISSDNLELLFVEPDFMGKGVGKILLEYVIQNFDINKVDVNEDNKAALGFYKHMGFRVVGRDDLDGTGKNYPILHMEL